VVTPDALNAAAIDAALVALTTDDRFSRNARDIAREIAAMPNPDAAVAWLEPAGPA
jgi:UDP:flavonoid glycosyltransferase YjiC (YdhE family)